MTNDTPPPLATRFRGYLPVVIDVETAGFNAQTDALLEVAAVLLKVTPDGKLAPDTTIAHHVVPFEGANLEAAALEFNGIDPYHPFRMALAEKEALQSIFKPIRSAIKANGCTRAILVGHNAAFDLNFLNAAVERTRIKRNPFHPFSTLDTVSLSALAYGQTVLARAAIAAGMEWDGQAAHSAIYDAEQTAELFCNIVNQWDSHIGIPTPSDNPAPPDNIEPAA
ncbi:MAG TPA: ribonuclease T [Chromatiales bacterium]|nr:ribonuclease T [Chromatiales bacterium]